MDDEQKDLLALPISAPASEEPLAPKPLPTSAAPTALPVAGANPGGADTGPAAPSDPWKPPEVKPWTSPQPLPMLDKMPAIKAEEFRPMPQWTSSTSVPASSLPSTPATPAFSPPVAWPAPAPAAPPASSSPSVAAPTGFPAPLPVSPTLGGEGNALQAGDSGGPAADFEMRQLLTGLGQKLDRIIGLLDKPPAPPRYEQPQGPRLESSASGLNWEAGSPQWRGDEVRAQMEQSRAAHAAFHQRMGG